MQEDADGLAGGTAREGLVEGVLPELHAQGPNRGVRDELGEADELQVEGAEGGVGVLDGVGDEAADEVRIVVACLELCQAVSPCGFDVGIGDVGAAAGVGAGEPF